MKGIRRLADHLDISIGTVSRALNGKPDVNAETRRRVLEAAEALGYVPNQSGRSLRQGTTNAVGFMIELNPETASSDNFFMGVFDGVQSLLMRHGLDLIVLPCPTGEDPLPYLQRFVARRAVDAMIISATQRIDSRIELLQAAGLPFLTLGRSMSGRDYAWIDLDFEGVVNEAIDTLVANGHRRIAMTVPRNEINLGYVCHDAYKAALRRHGLPYEPELVLRAGWSEQGGHEVADQLMALQNRPTALLLVYEMIAIGLYQRLNELGIVPGEDLAIVAFRDEPNVRFLSPPVTCFHLSLHDLGVGIGEAVLAQMPVFRDIYPLGIVQKRWPLTLLPGGSVLRPKVEATAAC
ncbi:MAG: LacI family DNA-binding transcriptional regulator [Devosia sp.]|nr:LacI family DNA-binding transcriptional regulator [Devosia sp.]